MYQTQTLLRRTLRVHYPEGVGRIVLRTELDWDQDVPADAVSEDGATSTFSLEAKKPFLYFKPVLQKAEGEAQWSVGANMLLTLTSDDVAEVYPHFDGSETGSYSPLIERDSSILGRKHMIRVYLPPGYHENPLRRFPVLYMQDGKNLFFPDEAFLGQDWGVGEAVRLLDAMNAVDRVVIVGVHSGDRMGEYTKPGYEAYTKALIEEVKPAIERRVRVLTSANETGVIGSSLGGVVSFYMAWEHPEVFGYAACMSSTFSHKDDLIDRVLAEPKHPSKFYLDSGWPGDNYEVTLAMAMALGRRGYKVRQDFLHLVFPLEEHDERAWGNRLHLPVQLGLGTATTAQRRRRG
ncbi:MAG TPA: alpha/beta hydrolase-fold protein [Vicinamibacteria bacterium]|nr:alpha/beta hydrolase-fold protein [Vicinamibacteria bacterium]HRB12110.1 alpha/beta hydrolase-fold protein [Vicinamibacteria bacterium]